MFCFTRVFESSSGSSSSSCTIGPVVVVVAVVVVGGGGGGAAPSRDEEDPLRLCRVSVSGAEDLVECRFVTVARGDMDV